MDVWPEILEATARIQARPQSSQLELEACTRPDYEKLRLILGSLSGAP